VWAYGRGQTDRQTDTQTRVTTIHFASSTTHATCNNRRIPGVDRDMWYWLTDMMRDCSSMRRERDRETETEREEWESK